MSLADIAAETGKSVRAIELASAKLIKEGYLQHEGPKKGGYWKVIKKA